MRGWRAVLVVLVALGLAAPAAARAAPQVKLVADCQNFDYGFVAAISGFPANTSLGVTLHSDPWNVGPVFFRTSASGAFLQPWGGGPQGHVRVDAFADVDGDQTQDPGEPAATGTIDNPCETSPLPGGTVVGSASGERWDDGTAWRLDIDAHGAPSSAGGTVTDTRSGVAYHGEVTCVGLRHLSATIGVRFPDGGPDGRSAEVMQLVAAGDGTYYIGAAGRDAAPGPGECPQPGSLKDSKSLVGGDQSITVTADTPDTTKPVIHGLDPVVADAASRRGAFVLFRNVYASDESGIEPAVECHRRSGARFPIGRTVVRCTATDRAGNTAVGLLRVRVRGPVGQTVAELAAIRQAGLSPGWTYLLERPLVKALRWLVHGHHGHRVDRLVRRFGLRARRLADHGLTTNEATSMVLASDRIRTVLGFLRPPHGPGAKLALLPSCDEPLGDIGGGPYGISMELLHGPRSAQVGLEVYLHGDADPYVTLDFSSNAHGHLGPRIGALGSPLGEVKVIAFQDQDGDQRRQAGEPVIAQASLDDPCSVVPRPAPLR